MKPIACLFPLLLCVVLVGCQSTEPVPPGTLTKQEQAIRAMSLDGLKIGDKTSALSRFAQVQKVPFGRSDYDVYDIYNPNSQISIALAYFSGDRLKRLEFRYFDGPTIRTLSRAGGWMGVRDYLIARFGPPSREGRDVRIVTDVPGLKAEHAKFNGEWIFSRQHRQLNFVAFSDAKGGIGVVTLQDTSPPPAPAPATVTTPAPGVRRTVVTVPATAKPAARPTDLPPAPPNPGF